MHCLLARKIQAQPFRLTKLFSLLSNNTKKTAHFATGIKGMPEYFQYEPMKQKIYTVYYTLCALEIIIAASSQSLVSQSVGHSPFILQMQDGNIERALILQNRTRKACAKKILSLTWETHSRSVIIYPLVVVTSALILYYANHCLRACKWIHSILEWFFYTLNYLK